ncbi:hypothetical protein GIB67_012339 [Kingdonia uniflora]|uniref:Uncharacterized protein n=1 Tax=Kingdonia uniflora TaxID=39325 RepID=A0A7J7MVU3_9MAGN|nr:hypothetical protein GIB67_012339 [Kingdonia uniflora]
MKLVNEDDNWQIVLAINKHASSYVKDLWVSVAFTTCNGLWTKHNNLRYDERRTTNQQLKQDIMRNIMNTSQLSKNTMYNNETGLRIIKALNIQCRQRNITAITSCSWELPKPVEIKACCDGSALGNPGLADIGIVYKNVEGEIAVKDIITKNPQSKYHDVDHDPLAQVFGRVKKGCVNCMGLDVTKRFESLKDMVASLRSSERATTPTVNVERIRMFTPLLREEAVVHFLNLHKHVVVTGRAIVLPGSQESEEVEYEGVSYHWIPYFLKAYNGLMPLPILGSVTTFELMV